ncbi:MAG: rhodanese-like domain-containing protein [Limnohabitans sp.]
MPNRLIFLACVVFSVWCSPLQAMTLERVGNDLYATGPTVDQDFVRFKQAFAQAGIERLILVNGNGGDLWTGMRVARMVQDAQLKTITSGFCMSACSLIFMAGQTRAFGTGHLPRVTMIGIHGASDKDAKTRLSTANPQMLALYKQQMGDKFNAQIIHQALYDTQEAYGFLRIRELQRNLEKDRTAWFCPSGQTPFKECQQHTGQDAYTLGVVTQTETETLTLPKAMQTQLGFFGHPLAPAAADLQDRAEALISSVCQDKFFCRNVAEKVLKNYFSSSVHKAIAIGLNKPGYGWRYGEDDPGVAILKALYACNHASGHPKLCRLVSVNDQELLPLYTEADTQARSLLQSAPIPDAMARQAEQDEPGGSPPSRLADQRHLTGMTPKMLAGIRRLDTAEFLSALQQDTRPVAIDVMAAGPTIPGTLNFIHAGLSFDDEKRETAFEERFRHMLKAAAPELNDPVIFYCASSECWLSVNAAMRARQIGYTQVMWYRGGLAAWMRAGLPTTHRTPVAILY